MVKRFIKRVFSITWKCILGYLVVAGIYLAFTDWDVFLSCLWALLGFVALVAITLFILGALIFAVLPGRPFLPTLLVTNFVAKDLGPKIVNGLDPDPTYRSYSGRIPNHYYKRGGTAYDSHGNKLYREDKWDDWYMR